MKPPPIVVAALVAARKNSGWISRIGTFGKGGYDAAQLGLMEEFDGCYELNLRGMDIADEAIALARRK